MVVLERRMREDRYLGKKWEKVKKCRHCKSKLLLYLEDIECRGNWDGLVYVWTCEVCNTANEPWFLPAWVQDYARDHRP